jgi:glycosyltransferase involved in cell wall biosynthesis
MNADHMRIVFVQFAGDYLEAYERFSAGGAENYHAQKYSVDYVENLSKKHEFVATICMRAEASYVRQLSSTLYSAGLDGASTKRPDVKGAIALLRRWSPTHVVLRTPIREIIGWCLKSDVAVLPVFADSFETRGIRSYLRHQLLAHTLNKLPLISNHNTAACLSLHQIGVKRYKIIPWDWPQIYTPDQFKPKTLTGEVPSILYVGTISENKGVSDLIRAAGRLEIPFRLRIIGDGADLAAMKALARDKGVAGRTEFHGRLAHDSVIDALRRSTVAVVQSRHSYPEGLPLTIYEALATRTPLVLSNHPVFAHLFEDYDFNFIAEDDQALAEKISELLTSPERYALASIETVDYWQRLQGSMEWSCMIEAWLAGDSKRLLAYSI